MSVRLKSTGIRIFVFLILLAAGLYLFREKILYAMGAMLVHAAAPVHADAVVTIGGDYSGHRILEAARLVKEGYAPFLLVSGAGDTYGIHETTLAIDLAVRNGYSRESMVAVQLPATSTAYEAKYDTEELRRRGVRSFILVTSYSHTARATRVFRRAAPDLTIHTVASEEKNWHQGRWWIDREGRKTFAFEAVKTIADFIGL